MRSRAYLMGEFELSEYAATNCMNARLPDGTANLSLQASKWISQKMHDDMLGQAQAVEAVAAEKPNFC